MGIPVWSAQPCTCIINSCGWSPGCIGRSCFGCCVHASTLSSWLLIKGFEGFLGWLCNALSSWPELAALKSPRQCCCGWWCRTMVLSHPIESLEESSPAFCVVSFVRPFHETTHWCRAGQNVLLPFYHFTLISPRIRMKMVDKMQGTGRKVFNDCKNLPVPPVFN